MTPLQPFSGQFTTPSPHLNTLLDAALSANSRKAYRSDLAHFTAWGGGIPATADLIAQYLADHAGKLAIATLARRLVSLGKAHTMQSLPNPTTADLVRMTMRGIRRTYGTPQRQAAAATKDDVLIMVGCMGSSLRDLRDKALLLIGFAGAFRRSELSEINCTNIERTSQGLIITVPRSKSDQEGHGRRIGIPFARGPICPVSALDAWLSAAKINDGALFRAVTKGERVQERLSGEAVSIIVKLRADQAGLDPRRYSGHSLRAGLATSAAAAGVAAWKIRQQTGHASDAMLARYIREGELFRGNAAEGLL